MRLQSLSGATYSSGSSSTAWHCLSQARLASEHLIQKLNIQTYRSSSSHGRLVCAAAASTDAPAGAAVSATAAAGWPEPAVGTHQHSSTVHPKRSAMQQRQHQQAGGGKQRRQQQQQQQQQRLQEGPQKSRHPHWQSKLTPQELQQLFSTQPKVLTAYIKASGSWQQLQQLLDVAGPAANHIHLAAAAVQCAQLQLQQQQQQQQQPPEGRGSIVQQQHAEHSSSCSRIWMITVVQQLLRQHHRSELELRHTSNLLWALAVGRSSSSSTNNSTDNNDSSSSRAEVPSSLLDSLLQLQLLQLQQHLTGHKQQSRTAVRSTLKPQDLSNSIWALAALQYQPQQLWLDAFWPLCMQQLPRLSLQELSNTAWGVAHLAGDVPCEWTQAFLQESGSRLEQLLQQQQQQQQCKDTIPAAAAAPCQALANIAYALASLQCTADAAWLGNFWSVSEPLLQQFTVQQLSMTLWAAARWCGGDAGSTVMIPGSWVATFAAAVQQQQQQQQDFSDQAVVNIAASSYQILLHMQHSLHRRESSAAAGAAGAEQGVQTVVQQLQHVLGLMLHVAAGRVQTLPVSAAAALAWASAGVSQQLPLHHSGAILQQQQQWLQQYVQFHTATAAASCSSPLQLLWLCAKAFQLPSSEDWCAGSCAALQQQLRRMPAGHLAQLAWSVAKLLDCCCSWQQQQQQYIHGHSLMSVGADETVTLKLQQQQQYRCTASIADSLTGLAVALLHVVPSQLQDMHAKQFTETVFSSANILDSLAHLQQQQQQQQKTPVPAAAAAAAAAAAVLVQAVAKQAGSGSSDLTIIQQQQQQQQLVIHAVYQLLLRCPHADVCSTEMKEALQGMLASLTQQQQQQQCVQGESGSSTYADVCLATRLLAVAQYPAHAAAASRGRPAAAAAAVMGSAAQPQAAAAVGPTAQTQAAAAAAAAVTVHSGQPVLPWVLLPGPQDWQQQLLDQLGSMPELNAQQLLSAAQLLARLRVVLPGSIMYRLLYALQGHITANCYSPRQLLHVLLVLHHWRVVPRSAVSVRTSLINSWLVMTQRCMYDAIRLQLQPRDHQQQQQQSSTSVGHSDIPEAPNAQSAAAAVQLDGDLMSMMLVGLARLRVHPSEQWMQLYIRLLLPLLPQMSPDHLTKVLIGLANLGYKPEAPVAQLLLRRSEQLLPGMTSSQLVRTMHALSKLQLHASESWMQLFYAAVEASADSLQLSGFGMVVWALAKAGAKPEQDWMEQLLQRTFSTTSSTSTSSSTTSSSSSSSSGVPTSPRLKPQHLANILCAFAKLGFTPGYEWMAWFRVQVGQQAGALQELDHFHIEWAWRELNEQHRNAASRPDGDSS